VYNEREWWEISRLHPAADELFRRASRRERGKDMTRYLIRQGKFSLVKLLLFANLMSFFIPLDMPGDWLDQVPRFLSGPEREAMKADLGPDLPLCLPHSRRGLPTLFAEMPGS
jgi:hypothetical protein